MLNGVAPEPVTNRELTAALGEVLSRPTVLAAPAFALRLALGDMADEVLLGSQRVMPVHTLEYGFKFRQPLLRGAPRPPEEPLFAPGPDLDRTRTCRRPSRNVPLLDA